MRNIEKTIKEAEACCLSSIGADGHPHVRAMPAPRARNGIKEFHLTTNTSSQKIAAFKKNPKACLYFFDASRFAGGEFTGTAEPVRDEESRKLVWHEGDEMYYPRGINDSDFRVIQFTARRVRHYHDLKVEEYTIE